MYLCDKIVRYVEQTENEPLRYTVFTRVERDNPIKSKNRNENRNKIETNLSLCRRAEITVFGGALRFTVAVYEFTKWSYGGSK